MTPSSHAPRPKIVPTRSDVGPSRGRRADGSYFPNSHETNEADDLVRSHVLAGQRVTGPARSGLEGAGEKQFEVRSERSHRPLCPVRRCVSARSAAATRTVVVTVCRSRVPSTHPGDDLLG